MSEYVDWSEHYIKVKQHLEEVLQLMLKKNYSEARKKAMDLSVDGHLMRQAITLEEEKWNR